MLTTLLALGGAVSASSLSVVQRENDGKIVLKSLKYQADLTETEKDQGEQCWLVLLLGSLQEIGEISGVIAALTLAFGSALQTASSQDDILAIAAHFKHLPCS